MKSIFDGFFKKPDAPSNLPPSPAKKDSELDPRTLSARPDLAPHWLPELEKERVTPVKGGFRHSTAKHAMLHGRKVFLKCIDFTQTYTAEKRAFIDAAIQIQPLHHEHLVHVLGFSVVAYSTTFCIVLEYMEKGTLFSCIHDPTFEWTDHLAWRMCLELATGLHYLHGHQRPYGRINPSKVLVNSANQCKWNVQHLMHPDQNHDLAFQRYGSGDAAYMAPEALNPRQHRRIEDLLAADVYSLAIVFGELLTKRRPHAELYATMGFVAADIHIATASGTSSPFPADCSVQWPHAFQQLMQQCLHCDPSVRPPMEHVVRILAPLAEPPCQRQLTSP
ncbi:Aste57867_16704 [Aphanomyces stellatus]|uniref:non-specific serine/threonine protein kinase n=1 Tax=Aphanomyces stellatus TaxID=120398 RepID=A0A485L685_9STRA|nr:hypothetical protein As57867_016647 [Aphanomyces stellatus]VFT93474.1 Aste57867_16704 [Aphanomyces stellatus]